MTDRRIVIAGTGSGVGKTTVTLAIMSALKQRGLSVQGFKCGPDYIDPSYHTAVTGRPSRNLDSWMADTDSVLEIFHRGSSTADISVIEGVMGFFDGKDPASNIGTTADISVITKSPVILIVNCSSMARSAAAIVKGFQVFSAAPNIVGVIANRVGSEGHYKIVKTAIEQECGIPVIGYLKREQDIEIPERHLGLIPSIERGELNGFFDRLGSLLEETVDLDLLLKLSEAASLNKPSKSIFPEAQGTKVRLAIAKDQAFNFYYQENLELLQSYGGELVFFSPLHGEVLPNDIQGLYLGGGFPEEYAAELADQQEVNQSIKEAILKGLPTLAECGGYMYLTESISTTENENYSMIGIIPGRVKMQSRLAALGYRTIKGQQENYLLMDGEVAKGHEFHYSKYEASEESPFAYETKGMRGNKKEGYTKHNLIAGYTHLYFPSCPALVTNWIAKCIEWKEKQESISR
ncbi:cobyrinate a,c-diamide synthase [Peribacillus saganii]|uniref:Cobyrinate a,c-diamide synthase n=1 Tax=Peribacillus saganii TaxID=2303992 RepID=A0A372LEZ2_9BACI|nr:cobyrinate a,c-diamide synthase [Peribacillus saganii]RFU64523.1 cobyrinate a,c-diamide synthase [Peribacillus saganii]